MTYQEVMLAFNAIKNEVGTLIKQGDTQKIYLQKVKGYLEGFDKEFEQDRANQHIILLSNKVYITNGKGEKELITSILQYLAFKSLVNQGFKVVFEQLLPDIKLSYDAENFKKAKRMLAKKGRLFHLIGSFILLGLGLLFFALPVLGLFSLTTLAAVSYIGWSLAISGFLGILITSIGRVFAEPPERDNWLTVIGLLGVLLLLIAAACVFFPQLIVIQLFAPSLLAIILIAGIGFSLIIAAFFLYPAALAKIITYLDPKHKRWLGFIFFTLGVTIGIGLLIYLLMAPIGWVVAGTFLMTVGLFIPIFIGIVQLYTNPHNRILGGLLALGSALLITLAVMNLTHMVSFFALPITIEMIAISSVFLYVAILTLCKTLPPPAPRTFYYINPQPVSKTKPIVKNSLNIKDFDIVGDNGKKIKNDDQNKTTIKYNATTSRDKQIAALLNPHKLP